MRLIDADALMALINNSVFTADMTTTLAVNMATRWIENAPTIEPEPQWIPCGERMPATEDKVLCQTITKKGVVNFVIGYYTEEYGWACGMNSNVVAWMPLPEPYEEVE